MTNVSVHERPAATDAVVFVVGDQGWRWADVIRAATRWGDWAEVEERVREGLACQERRATLGPACDPDALAAAASAFRYARELLTAVELEAWLERWGLTREAWMDHVDRSLLCRQSQAELPQIVARYPVSAAAVADRAWSEAVCSGDLAELARRVAGRAAVAAGTDGLAGAGAGRSPVEPLEHLAALDRHFERFRQRVVTPVAVRAAIEARRLEWTRLRCLSAAFAHEHAAREAALCVREDGEALAGPARAAQAPLSDRWLCLDEAPPAARPLLLGAGRGAVVGPLAEADGYVVTQIVEKTPPSPDDPMVRSRAAEAVLRAAVDREIDARVRWRVTL